MADNNGSLFEIPPLDEELIGGSSAGKFDHASSVPFSTFSPPPLPPPLDSFADFSYPSKNTNEFSSAGESNLADDDTGFGDFSSAFPPPPVASNDLPVAKEPPAGNHGNDDDEFGDMTGFEFTTSVPLADTNDGFGSFSASIAPASQDGSEKGNQTNGFGDFTAASTTVNEQNSFAVEFDQHKKSSSGDSGTATNQSHGTMENITKDEGKNDQFGDFASTGFVPDNDDFGDFTTSTIVQSSSADNNVSKEPFNAFTTSSNDTADDFGSFTQTTTTSTHATFPSSTYQQPPPLPDDDGDDDFGDFGEFSSKPTSFAAPVVTPPTTKASAAPTTTEQVKVPTDILIVCFPLNVINQLEQTKGTLFNDSSVSSLSKQASSTDLLYQWNQSLLQDRFFNALKVDPMLVPASGSTGGVDTDPFALTNLLTDLGGTGIEMKPSSFNWPKEASDEVGGATLLDLSLPMSPIGKDGKDSEGLTLDEDLKTLDFNAASSEQSVGVVKEVGLSSSWMDSELLELEEQSQEPATGVGRGNAGRSEGGGLAGGLEWLNNPKLTTMVKPIADSNIDLLPSLEPTSSSIIELERSSTTQQESQQVTTDQRSTSNGLVSVDVKGSDNIASLSPSPDPSMVGLIPPDPILSMPTTNNVSPDPLPTLSAPDPPPLSVPEQEKMQVASFGLDMVMEMTSHVTTVSSASSFAPAKDSTPSNDDRLTLSPPRSGIDILEDQILEMTIHKEKSNGKPETMGTSRSLSKEARTILQKLPNLSFMRR